MTEVSDIQVPQVNELPVVPLRSEAGNTFAIKAEAFVAALPTFRVGMIALESVTRQLALIAQEKATAAVGSATAAANSATAAGTAKAAAESAKTAAASSATAAGTAKTAAEAAKTAAAGSATAAATSAVYAKDRLDYVITQAGLTVNTADATQLQAALLRVQKKNNPIIRLTKNQALAGTTGSTPNDWAAHANCTFEKVCTVTTTTPNTRPVIARDLLTYIGIVNETYLFREFAIWRVTWPANTPYLMFQTVNLSNYITTCAAYTKVESGQVTGAWTTGADSTWKLTGEIASGNKPHWYWNIHPVPSTAAGSLLFALPAAVIGAVNLNDQQNWAIYPYIGDQQYD